MGYTAILKGMLLLSGPPGSGRTSYVLAEFREALRRNDATVRLLTPTATMAEHFRHKLAREGFVLRPNLVGTLSKFVAPWAEDLPEISAAGLYLLVEKVAKRLAPPEFARVLDTPGFCAALARAVEEFSSAGCDAARLGRSIPRTPFGPAFLAVYAAVEAELARRGVGLRASRLELAARKIERGGLGGVCAVWMDGFFAFSDPELAVIRAIGSRVPLTVTLPSAAGSNPTRDALLSIGFAEQHLERRRAEPALKAFSAPGVDREATEIARRILGHGDFGQVGIIVRNPEVYLEPLRAALARFGIPARFYFSPPLAEHRSAKFLAAVTAALLGGWDYAATLAAIRMSGDSPALDRFDFAVRERLPNSGLAGLRELTEDAEILRLLVDFTSLEDWRSATFTPAQWAARLGSLRKLVRAPRPTEGAGREMAMLWRGQSSALDGWELAMEDAAQSFEGGPRISLAEFWTAAQAVLRLTPLRIPDPRRNVVHVLSVYEARQWELPVVFICGLVEQQFPKRQAQEPLFPDLVRVRLAGSGIRVRTAEELESEERFLFELARTRAAGEVILSYAEYDSRGARNVPSRFLSGAVESCARITRPEPAPAGKIARGQEAQPVVRAFTPSALECFLDCPFQYFSRYTLRLRTRPLAPRERLDFRLQGTIVHQTLAEWHRSRRPIAEVFDQVFSTTCEKNAVASGYRVERLRAQMLDDLLEFCEAEKLPIAAEVLVEQSFDLLLDDGTPLRGRIDRIDKLSDGRALIVDYKYSGKANVAGKLEKPNLLQAGLYALAVERTLNLKPAGVFYYGLKKDSAVVGWSDPPDLFIASEALTRDWMERVAAQAREAAEGIRAGRIEAAPSSLDLCRLCDYRDVCRYEGARRALAAG